MADRIAGYAKLRTPTWLWGGDPRKLLTHARLRSRPVRNEPGVWAVRTEESYLDKPPTLFTHSAIAGPDARTLRYEDLGTFPHVAGTEPNASVTAKVNRLADRARNSGALTALIVHAQLALATASPSQLPNIARHVVEQLTLANRQEDASDRPFSSAGMDLITSDPALVHRIKFPSVWLRLEYDPRLSAGNLDHIKPQEDGTLAFASAFDLQSGMLTFDAYVAPLMGCLSPFIWGFATPRTFGNLIVTLGTPIAGATGEASELLQTLGTQSTIRSVRSTTIDRSAYFVAIDWWTTALNKLFAVLTDFSVFVDARGFYNPTSHLHALLSVEQLFRRVVSIQAAHRDIHARRVLMFTVLDTLQRLTGRPLDKNCSLAFAQKTLDNLKFRLPAAAQQLLLPRAEDAVSALDHVQSGFFMAADTGGIPIPDTRAGSGTVRELSLEDAAAEYIKVLRDATHGHGTNREAAADRTNALLAHHTGELPAELGYLGFLYLLDMLSRPEVLRRTLQTRAASSREGTPLDRRKS